MTPEGSEMSDPLDRRIRDVDPMAGPEAPDPESFFSGGFWTKVIERRERDRRQRRYRAMALAGVAGLALAVGLGLALVPGGIGSPDLSSAAVALRTIADDTSPPATAPASGTWLYRTMDFSILSPSTTIDGNDLAVPVTAIRPTPARSVALTGVLRSWVNETKGVQSATFQSPQFGSPRRRAAWQAAGLLTSPVIGTHAIASAATLGPHSPNQGIAAAPPSPRETSTPTRTSARTGTASQTGTYFTNGLYPVNVSGLPKTPANLAKALKDGKRGVPGLYGAQDRRSPEAAFERAVLLLLSPTVGGGLKFSAEVYRSIALLPHVVSLGTVWTHAGQAGQGFAASKDSDAATMVVNRKGKLLEVRNLRLTTWLQTLATMVSFSFCATSVKAEAWGDPPLVNQLYFTTDWIDPVGTPTPVRATAVPTPVPEPRAG
jgi:hypothetical protein